MPDTILTVTPSGSCLLISLSVHLCSLCGKSFKWVVPESGFVTDFNKLLFYLWLSSNTQQTEWWAMIGGLDYQLAFNNQIKA